ncbi:ABC transporter substrate-binding protein [Kiloniella spongiae]|uniref:ABC transporter substrate-binding protein n=1 Tax=Kiloniella spongiae TaxID=1489064 RepID=UPI0012E09391|nr:ABC transporter substrate-binding protein [Kiloniella spongiae]
MPLSARITKGSHQFIKLVVAIYVLLAFALSFSVITQATAQSLKRIIVLETMAVPVLQDATKWFRQGMSDLGYTEGSNVEYVILNAEGNIDKAHSLLEAELNNQKPDMVMSVATLATRATHSLLKDKKIPQVFIFVSYPDQEGFVSAVGQKTGTNMTGKTHIVPPAAKLEVVKQALKPLTDKSPLRIGIVNSTYPSALSETAQLMEINKQVNELSFIDLNFEYQPGSENSDALRESALKIIEGNRSDYDALWFVTGPLGNDSELFQILNEKNIPVIFANNTAAVKSGAMISMVSNAEVNGIAAAEMVNQIFKGTKAGDIPVTRPNSYLVSINVTTATELGTVIPSSLLKLAGKNIYR